MRKLQVKIVLYRKEIHKLGVGAISGIKLDDKHGTEDFSNAIVAIETGMVVGFCAFREFMEEMEVLELCVHENYRRHGIARLMLRHLRDELGDVNVIIAVSEYNRDAQEFLSHIQFIATDVLSRYYACGRDAYQFEGFIK